MATQKDIKQIKQSVSLLRYAAESGIRFERRGEEYWACCPFHDEKSPSFAIKLKDGDEVFFCQGCRKGGDLITFVELREQLEPKDAIAKLRGLSFAPDAKSTFAQNSAYAADAERVAGAFTNIVDANTKPKETVSMMRWLPFEKALASNPKALQWLEDKRGITAETAAALHFGFQQVNERSKLPPEGESARGTGWILFPRVVGDDIVAIKKRSMVGKFFTQVPNMDPKALFNSEAANAIEDLFITEGEFDTAIFEQAGFRAASIPNASVKLTPENKIIMKRAARIFLAGDNDGSVGNAAMRGLRRELCDNTYVLEWPGAKDANQFFIEVCNKNITEFQKQVKAMVAQALSTPAEGFISLAERVRQAALTGGTDLSGDPHRLHFPYRALDNMSFSVPGSVVTFYSTYSGTGKTVFTTQVMIAEAERGETVVVYSPEVRDNQYLALVAAQLLGPSRLPVGLNRAGKITTQDYVELGRALAEPSEKGEPMQYYVGHGLPVSDGEKILEFIEKVIVATGATRFVIDTFHRIVTPVGREGVVDAEGRTMRELEAMAIKHSMIFIIIGQSNKEAEDLKEVRKDAQGTLRGNREITDISDAVYLIHRKRSDGEVKENVDLLSTETTVILAKGRVQGTTGKFCRLTYKKECSKFYEVVDYGNDEPTPPMDAPGELY